MTTFTDLEKKVFNASIDDCKTEYCIDVRELAETTDLTVNQVKGVLGSLAKKELIEKDEEGDFFPLIKDEDGFFTALSYGEESYSEEHIDSHKI